jgi:DNA-binding NarL/FixJ family response regulator
MRILLASTNLAVVERWRGLLATHYSVEHASSLGDIENLAADGSFDLILLHRLLVDLPVFAEIRRSVPDAKFFLLSDQPDEEEGLAFLKLGIVGYGNTYIAPERLETALRVVEAGGVWLGQKIIRQLMLQTHFKANEVDPHILEQRLAALTRMERKVTELVARGLTNLEIAAELTITERTVKAHLTAIYEKVHVGNRLSLALLVNHNMNG